jgi:hypothetical protein
MYTHFEGCDNYDAIPLAALDNNPIKNCNVPDSELEIATQDHVYWKDVLDEFYPAFFNKENEPIRETFRKIQHLPLMDAILGRYPKLKVVWAHIGLSKELQTLHPRTHTHILEHLFRKYKNLYIDLSWDILAHLLLLNFDKTTSVEELSANIHSDIHAETILWNNAHIDKVNSKSKISHNIMSS